MKDTYHYHGMECPRMQKCAFCGTEYDALYGYPRPHGVCNDCWPEVNRIEREASDRHAREEGQ